MKIMIIGCGRVGSRLAIRMERGGHEVTVIDSQRDAFIRLGGNFRGITLQGSGLDIPILRRGKIDEMNCVVAVTGGDNRNLMIVQLAKIQCNAKRAVARLKDPVRAAKFRDLGVETLCVTTVIEGLLELWAQNGEFPELPGEMSVAGDCSALFE
jgi:trk system potassium uptake protein TrkA